MSKRFCSLAARRFDARSFTGVFSYGFFALTTPSDERD